MQEKKNNILKSILAGIMIGFGAYAYVICISVDLKPLGYVLFSLGLLSCFYLNLNLFTGKIGSIQNNADSWKALGMMVVFNAAGIILIALPVIFSDFSDVCKSIVDSKLQTPLILTIFNSIFCGMIIQLAVELKDKNQPITTILCVMVFLVCGFEHCIANIFYYVGAASFSFKGILYFLIYICGNSIGGIVLKHLIKGANKTYENN